MTKVFTDGLSFALPLLIMAIGAIYSEKSGVTNLAIEGFQGFGAFIGALAAILIMPRLSSSSQLPIYIAILFAAVGGGIYACLHALLSINFKANQVISGVVVNILAVALTTFFTSAANTAINGTASNKFILGVSSRYSIPFLSKIPWIGGLFQRMYPFEWIICFLAFIFWYLMYRTRYGMRLRACGENPQALDAAGGDVVKTRWIAVFHHCQFLPEHLHGLRLSGHRGHDFRQLGYSVDSPCLPFLRSRESRGPAALPCHEAFGQLYGSFQYASLRSDHAAADLFLKAEPSAESMRAALGPGAQIKKRFLFICAGM